MSSKTSLIVGGNGALGRAVCQAFKNKGWTVASIDLQSNDLADMNILVNPEERMAKQAQNLVSQSLSFSAKYDSIICVAGGFDVGSVSDISIFEQYAHQDKINFQTALLSGHIATQGLRDEGLLMFSGAAAVFEGPVNFAYAYYLAKSTTHALALQMAERKEIPENSTVVTMMPQILDTPANRAAMPDVDKKDWAPCDKVGIMIR